MKNGLFKEVSLIFLNLANKHARENKDDLDYDAKSDFKYFIDSLITLKQFHQINKSQKLEAMKVFGVLLAGAIKNHSGVIFSEGYEKILGFRNKSIAELFLNYDSQLFQELNLDEQHSVLFSMILFNHDKAKEIIGSLFPYQLQAFKKQYDQILDIASSLLDVEVLDLICCKSDPKSARVVLSVIPDYQVSHMLASASSQAVVSNDNLISIDGKVLSKCIKVLGMPDQTRAMSPEISSF